jgi:hypothetical protein
MPRTCTVCSHPERAAIDEALVAGERAAIDEALIYRIMRSDSRSCCGVAMSPKETRMLTRRAICRHSQSQTIRARLLAGETPRTLSRDYALPVRELTWHRDEHVLGRRTRRRPRR